MALRTLIVDDEPLAILRMTALCAELDGVAVVGSAGDGAAALAAIAELAPDPVLLDIAMPGMSGIGVARAVERLPRHRATTDWGCGPRRSVMAANSASRAASSRRRGAWRKADRAPIPSKEFPCPGSASP